MRIRTPPSLGLGGISQETNWQASRVRGGANEESLYFVTGVFLWESRSVVSVCPSLNTLFPAFFIFPPLVKYQAANEAFETKARFTSEAQIVL